MKQVGYGLVQYRNLPSPRWGWYAVNPTAGAPSVRAGEGPWEGEYILVSPNPTGPQPTVVGLFLHHDLSPNGPDYPGASDTTQTCPDAASLPDSSNVYTVNHRCGTGSNLDNFRAEVLEHEKKHQISGNLCIAAASTQVALDRMTAVLVRSHAKAAEELDELWLDAKTGLGTKLYNAFLTNQSHGGALIYDWRNIRRWARLLVPGDSHGGTWGC